MDLEDRFRIIKEAMIESANEIIPKGKWKERKENYRNEKKWIKKKGNLKWMTDEIFALMNERRKGKQPAEIKELDILIRNKCNQAKIKYLNEQCKETEKLERHNSRG